MHRMWWHCYCQPNHGMRAPVQVRALVEEGKADLAAKDRWGATALDEAMRAGNRAIMEYLQVCPLPH